MHGSDLFSINFIANKYNIGLYYIKTSVSTKQYYCMFNQFQKVALITGSAQRIGKYLAENLAQDGWALAIHYNSSEKQAIELARSLINTTNVDIFKADLNNAEEVSNLIPSINKKLGKVSLHINNASIYKNDTLHNLDRKNLDENFNVHVNAPIFIAKAISLQNIEADIINILDTDITIQPRNFFSYSISKKSLNELTKMLALVLSPDIKVNAIAPGPTLFKEGQNQEIFNKLVDESPLKKKLDLSELYQTIDFLVKCKSITGQVIFLDAGRHLL